MKLERLKQKYDLTVLDLRGGGFTEADVPVICEIIKNNPGLLECHLAHNDLRGRVVEIFKALSSCKHLYLLDIVDNNIDGESTWRRLADFVEEQQTLTHLYIGAKRIYGPSNARHQIYDSDLKFWKSGFFGTGFNELVCRDVHAIEGALRARMEAGYPLKECYLTSKNRSWTEVAESGGEFRFFKTKDPSLDYNPQSYRGDSLDNISGPTRNASL